jgi:hypothetical protein
LYVGDDFYAPVTNAAAAKASGFNALFLFTLHVYTNGDVYYNNTLVAQNGSYVGDSNWGTELAALRPTINRIELVIGSRGEPSFANIKNLINSQGTGSSSILYKNFQALENATGVDAIQYDDEQTYDVSSAVAFGNMITGLGLKVTLCSDTSQSYWTSVKSQLGTNVDAIYLQCYDGGAGNSPASWISAFGGFKVYPGLWGNTNTPSSVTAKMRNWQQTLGITGGFMWLNGTMPGDASKWAKALSYGLDPVASLRIINKNSGESISLAGGGMTNGTAINQRDYDAGNNQRWMLVPTENGDHFKIISWASGKCASIANDSCKAGTQLLGLNYNSEPSQQFDLIDAGNGWFRIKNVRSGLLLEVKSGSMPGDAAVRQNADTGTPNQLWKLYPYGDDVLAYENFDYPVGNLGGQSGDEGWSGVWQDNAGSVTLVTAGSLVGGTNVPAGYDVRSSGNSAFVPDDQRVGRYLDCTRSGIFGSHGYLDVAGHIGADGKTLYISFLQRPRSTSTFYEFELHRGDLGDVGRVAPAKINHCKIV